MGRVLSGLQDQQIKPCHTISSESFAYWSAFVSQTSPCALPCICSGPATAGQVLPQPAQMHCAGPRLPGLAFLVS